VTAAGERGLGAAAAWYRSRLVRVAVSVAVLGALLLLLPVDDVLAGLRAIPAGIWPAAIIAYLLCHAVGVAKWRLLVNTAGAALPLDVAFRAYYWGLFGNTFLPSIVGGDVVRAGVAMQRARSRSALILGSLVDRVQDVVGLCVLAGTGALLSPRALDDRSRRVFLSLTVVLAAVAAAGVLVARFFPVRRVPFRYRRVLVRVRAAVRACATRPAALAGAFGLGLLLQTLLVALNWWLGRLVGIDAPFYVWLFVWPLAKLSGLVPVTQGGIGVREAAQAALFAPFGVSAAQAVAAGLVFEVVLIGGGLLSGGLARLAGRGQTR
jgi:uncharacterized membrane protein YbhN (UPF0104 family)